MEDHAAARHRKAVKLGLIIGLCVFLWYLGAMILVLQP